MSRTLRSQRGYTAVEVLIAMTLFAIGAAGVIGMMKVTTQGTSDARRFDIATNIANEWLSRLQRDATFWTLPNDADPITSNLLTNTIWLKDINTAACNGSTAGKYCTPTIPATNENGRSPAFDVAGRDMPSYVSPNDHFFCVQYRLSWIAADTGATCGGTQKCPTALIRADIRVFWKRQEYGTIPNCATLTDDPDTVPNKYHFVYATTSVRENQLQ